MVFSDGFLRVTVLLSCRLFYTSAPGTFPLCSVNNPSALFWRRFACRVSNERVKQAEPGVGGKYASSACIESRATKKWENSRLRYKGEKRGIFTEFEARCPSEAIAETITFLASLIVILANERYPSGSNIASRGSDNEYRSIIYYRIYYIIYNNNPKRYISFQAKLMINSPLCFVHAFT